MCGLKCLRVTLLKFKFLCVCAHVHMCTCASECPSVSACVFGEGYIRVCVCE